jgi:hypothetical protein
MQQGAAAPVASLRFLLQEPIFAAGPGVSYWRARESRTGRERVVRVIEAEPASHPRWLEQLHRERAFADRLASPHVLRTHVPQVEGARIVQAVEPAPARLLAFDGGQRMSALRAALRLAETLAHCHAQGQAHGTLAATSVLASATGEPLLCGFGAAGGSAHDLRQHAARDISDVIDRATEMLAASGGPPARLRQAFESGEPMRGMDPMLAMAWLRDEFREALEDTFPWPVVPQQPRSAYRPTPPAPDAGAAIGTSRSTGEASPGIVDPPPAKRVAVQPTAPPAAAPPAVAPAAVAPAAAAAAAVRMPSPLPAVRSAGLQPSPRWLVAAAALLCVAVAGYFALDSLRRDNLASPGEAAPSVPDAAAAPPMTAARPVAVGPSSPVEIERAVAAAVADGESRLRGGEPDVARAWFEHALSLDPASERARRGLQSATEALEARRPGLLARLFGSTGAPAP